MEPEILTLADLARVGIGADEVRRKVASGELVRVRSGALRRGGNELNAADAHRHLLAATLPRLDDEVVISHGTAALLHGLPVPHAALARVSGTRSRPGQGYQSKTLRVRGCPLASDEIVTVHGVPTTSLARTVVDLARELPFDWAVGAADAALRLGLTEDEFADNLRRWPRRPGLAGARAVADFADRRAESVGESRSRALFARQGVPTPELQFEVWWRGQLLGRSDFAWPEHGVLGEFDGAAKYTAHAQPGEDVVDAVMREKRRENGLRASGWLVVRWDWAELEAHTVVVRRLRAALASGPGRIAS